MSRNKARLRRHTRIRKKIQGSAELPRLCVFRSNAHIEAQLVDDVAGHTLISASTKEKGANIAASATIAAASEVGRRLGERAAEKKIQAVVFDRGGYKYHGRVAALASAVREAGIKF